MEDVLTYLKQRRPDDVPMRLQGQAMSPNEAPAWVSSHTTHVPAGRDPDSCTATVAALMHWLCGLDMHVCEIPRGSRRPISSLPDQFEEGTLTAVYTPHHRFAVLQIDDKAALLHSNSDDYTYGSRRFSLRSHLQTLRVWNVGELKAVLGILREFPRDDVMPRLFGIMWRGGHPDDWWWTSFRVRMGDV